MYIFQDVTQTRPVMKFYPTLLIRPTLLWPIGDRFNRASLYFMVKMSEHKISIYSYRDKVVASLSTIHGHVLRECHQIPWAGDDHLLSRAESPPEDPSTSEPRSLSILQEKISLKHQHNGEANVTGGVFVGPTTYIQFMHCFRHIFRDKRKEAIERVDKLT